MWLILYMLVNIVLGSVAIDIHLVLLLTHYGSCPCNEMKIWVLYKQVIYCPATRILASQEVFL
jgi:hypothetical protein